MGVTGRKSRKVTAREKKDRILLLSLFLMFGVIVSGVLLFDSMDNYIAKETNVIALVPQNGPASSNTTNQEIFSSDQSSNQNDDQEENQNTSQSSDQKVKHNIVASASSIFVGNEKGEEEQQKQEQQQQQTEQQQQQTEQQEQKQQEQQQEQQGEEQLDLTDVFDNDDNSDDENSDGASFEVKDENNTVWETDTEVEIFHISYVNGEQQVTVQGANGDPVIAPGTENDYTFRLKNTGDTTLEYAMEIQAYTTPEEKEIPIVARIKNYNGTYLLGGETSWEDVKNLNGLKDKASLAKKQYAQYTLEWQWPFESGNDSYDTELGNLAVDGDISLTIKIKTSAYENQALPLKGLTPESPENLPDAEEKISGIKGSDDKTVTSNSRIKTGDNAHILRYTMLAIGAVVVLLLLLFFRRRKKEEQDE